MEKEIVIEQSFTVFPEEGGAEKLYSAGWTTKVPAELADQWIAKGLAREASQTVRASVTHEPHDAA